MRDNKQKGNNKMKTVSEIGKINTSSGGFISPTDYIKIGKRLINYVGAGMYSLDDDNVYHKGTFATFSRIKMA